MYKSDGTTLLGTYGGFYTNSDIPTPTACSGWGFWTPAGMLKIITPADCTSPPRYDIYYDSMNCQGTGYTYSTPPDIFLNGTKCYTTSGSSYYLRSYSRRFSTDGSCNNTIDNCQQYYVVHETSCSGWTGYCGIGNCIVK